MVRVLLSATSPTIHTGLVDIKWNICVEMETWVEVLLVKTACHAHHYLTAKNISSNFLIPIQSYQQILGFDIGIQQAV